MKNTIVILCFIVLCSGCKGVNRIMNGGDTGNSQPIKIISSIPAVGGAPTFNIELPAGYTRSVFHGAIDPSGLVKITANKNALINVFLKQRDYPIKEWFHLSDQFSGAYYYEYDPTTGEVQYRAGSPSLTFKWIEYCVYEDIPAVPS